jgi:signal transduction histidine kinase
MTKNERPMTDEDSLKIAGRDVLKEKAREAAALLLAGETARVRDIYQTLVQQAPEDYRLYHNLALALYKDGNFTEAAQAVEKAGRLNPQSAKSHYLSGLINKDAHALQESIEDFDRALHLDEDFVSAYYQRGIACFLLERFDEARQNLEKVLLYEPGSLSANHNLGVVELAAQNFQRSAECFSACARLDPAHAQDYHRLLVEIGRGQVYQEIFSQGHRLKNLLGILAEEMRGLCGLLAKKINAGLKDQLEEVTERHNLLYSDMAAYLATLRQEPLEMDLADVHDLIDGAIFAAPTGRSQSAAGETLKGIEVKKRYDRGLEEIVLATAEIKEAFLNIILNACEAMPGGGVLTITTGVSHPEAAQHPRGASSPDEIFVRFADSGAGIKPEDLPKVFDFGYTTKPYGSGIGLSLTKRIVEVHGGRIEAESTPGEGSSFTVVLPTTPKIDSPLVDLSLKPTLYEDPKALLVEEIEKVDLVL